MMARWVKAIAAITVAAAICFSVIYVITAEKTFLTLAITFGTVAYHFAMRLVVGLAFQTLMHNKADYHKRWYQVKPWEQKIYQRLNVKRWKRFMPTYDSALFDPSLHSWDEIAQATCQAELVHETIVVLSFVPIFFAISFGEWAVFIITSVLSAAFDLCFVIMQRYNRPRVIRCAEKEKARKKNA